MGRVKVINKLVRCLECLSVGCSVCVYVRVCDDDAGVSVSERCLKGVKIVRWWVLCSQITASDNAQEKHWLYLSSAPYLIWGDVSLSSRGLSKDRFPPCATMQCGTFKPSRMRSGPTWNQANTHGVRLIPSPARRLLLAMNPRVGLLKELSGDRLLLSAHACTHQCVRESTTGVDR